MKNRKHERSKFTPSKVISFLNGFGLILKTIRTDGIITFLRKTDKKVVASFAPYTRRFYVKDKTKNGVNANWVVNSPEVKSFNELRYCALEALEY